MQLPHVISGEFHRAGGLGWRVAVPEPMRWACDTGARPRMSPLVLKEDGVVLGPGHAAHQDIEQVGGGRFSVWDGTLYFSTSDGSDPNVNGRAYALDLAPVEGEASRDGSALERMTLDPSAMLAGAGHSFVADVSGAAAEGDDNAHPYRSTLMVFEDGKLLGPAHAGHAEIAQLGGGRFSHWQTTLYFSASDSSDPRTNGRRYELMSPQRAVPAPELSLATEILRSVPPRFALDQAGQAIEEAIRALIPNSALGSPHKTWLHEAWFFDAFARFVGPSRRTAERKWALYQIAKALKGVSGEAAECGVLAGTTAYFTLLAFRETGQNRVLHLFDSFEGLSRPGEFDGEGWAEGDLAREEALLHRNLKGFDNYEVHRGWIPERFPDVADKVFSCVHLDVDLYQPTKDAIEFFFPRMSPGAVMVCDDYGSTGCPGARKAMDDYFGAIGAHVIELPTGQGVVWKPC